MPDRPNILYLFTDQQTYNAMSCAGNTDLHTPNMDRLAEGGIRFENAYCAFPLCGPSRASMFFGQMPHELGIRDNGQAVQEPCVGQSLGHVLGQAGYDCAYGGKWHVPEISMPDGVHGFRTICAFDDIHLPERCTEYFQTPRDQPFFLVASFDNPHNICEFARHQIIPWGRLPAEPPLAEMPNLPANFDVPAFEPRILQVWRDKRDLFNLANNQTPVEWRRYRWGYNRLVEMVDRQIGKILDSLEQAGLAENTVVLFSSDHGDCQGAHRLPQKWTCYDESTRVPVIVRAPQQTDPGRVNPALVNNGLDIYATVCDYAQATSPAGTHGVSLRPLVEGRPDAEPRDHVVTESWLDVVDAHLRMVRTERYKYTTHSVGLYQESLVDLQNDPGEMVNLAVEKRHADLLQHHRDLLAGWCEKTHDGFGRHYAHPEIPFIMPGTAFGS